MLHHLGSKFKMEMDNYLWHFKSTFHEQLKTIDRQIFSLILRRWQGISTSNELLWMSKTQKSQKWNSMLRVSIFQNQLITVDRQILCQALDGGRVPPTPTNLSECQRLKSFIKNAVFNEIQVSPYSNNLDAVEHIVTEKLATTTSNYP